MPPSILHVGLVAGRLWHHSLRRPAIAYLLPTVMPLGLVIFISQLYSAMATRPGYPTDDLLDWMGPGIVFLAVTMGGGFTGTLLVVDARSGFLDRVRLLPFTNRAVIVGCLFFEGVRIVPVAVVLLGAASLLGLALPSPAALAVLIALAVTWSATWNAMFLLAALRTRSDQLSLVLLPLFLPFFLGSTIMVPKTLLPDYVQTLIAWNPLDRFVTAARPLFDGATTDLTAIATAVIAAAALIAVLGTATIRELDRQSAR